MPRLSVLVRTIKFLDSVNGPSLPVPRDRLPNDYHLRRESEKLERQKEENYKVHVEFSPATKIETRQEYLYPNVTYHF